MRDNFIILLTISATVSAPVTSEKSCIVLNDKQYLAISLPLSVEDKTLFSFYIFVRVHSFLLVYYLTKKKACSICPPKKAPTHMYFKF